MKYVENTNEERREENDRPRKGQKLVSFSDYRRAPQFQTFQKHAEWDSQ